MSSGGSLTQLISLGSADKYLTANPSITFWRSRFHRYSQFAMEPIEQSFQTAVAYGSEAQLTFNRVGDLIAQLYVVATIDGIYPDGGVTSTQFPSLSYADLCDTCWDETGSTVCDTNTMPALPSYTGIAPAGTDTDGHWCHYVDAVGFQLVRQTKLIIGGQTIDTISADYMACWDELSGQPGKRLKEMVGKSGILSDMIMDSMVDRRLYIPLPFWFTQSSGNALPIVSLQFHGIQLNVQFAELKSCVVTSCLDAGTAGAVGGPTVKKVKNNLPLIESDLKAVVEANYVFLDIEERDKFAVGSFEQLITQVQSMTVAAQSQQVRLNLNFNHPVVELIWFVRRMCQEAKNQHFNFSGRNGNDPVAQVSLRLNNLPRFSQREGRYFRLVTPYQSHTNIPNEHIYVFPFALKADGGVTGGNMEPSGSANFSRIDNVELVLDMQKGLSDANVGGSTCSQGHVSNGHFSVTVFGRNFNVLRFREGLSGLAYSS